MKPTFYYTVILCRTFFIIKYATSEGRVLTFPGTFNSVTEAEEQFKKDVHGKLIQLSESAFQRKAGELAERYRQDLTKLADWNIGRTIRI